MIAALRSFVLDHPESFEASTGLVQKHEFAQLGLTDVSLLSLSKTFVVVTLDHPLHNRILAAGGQAIHFDHVRETQTPRQAGNTRSKHDA